MDSSEAALQRYFGRTRGRVYNFYISGSIGDAVEYQEWFQEIRTASENDLVVLHINSNGGDLFTTVQFLRVLQETRATVVTSVEGACMSAATVIFLASGNCEVSQHSIFMFHDFSTMVAGKGGELRDQVLHYRKWSEKIFRHVYEHFLTDEELDSIFGGKELWMESDEVVKRLKKRATVLRAKMNPKKKPNKKTQTQQDETWVKKTGSDLTSTEQSPTTITGEEQTTSENQSQE